MDQGRNKPTAGPLLSRGNRVRCAILALAALSLVLGTACDEEENLRAFRAAASSGLQSGVNSIMDGFIDGVFAIIDQGTDQTVDGSSTTTDSGTGS